jgi:murein L,D-transpeptidase YafK
MRSVRLSLCTRSVLVLLLALVAPTQGRAEGREIWLLVDTQVLTLEVKAGDQTLARFEGIAIGRGGVAKDRVKGDQKTPLGKFRVAWLNPNSRYHYFIGLDYPQRTQVDRAFRKGVLDEVQHSRLLRSLYEGGVPLQNSPLGGQIGIHGLGRADPQLHELSNWTEGCVALTNEQIDRLRDYVRIGMTVLIR